MKRSLVVLLAGLIVGVGAHLAWFQFRHPATVSGLNADLAWMKGQLELSSDQLARIQALHEQSSPRLLALAEQVAHMEQEFAAFERSRQTDDEVDFLEFARFVQQRRTLEKECDDSARKLIAASAEIMTPAQRQRYLTLVSPALDAPTSGLHN